MIGILDYGVGNIGSIVNLLKKLGHVSVIVDAPEKFKAVTKIILPGVGAFDPAMQLLKERGFLELLQHKVLEEKSPVLGICLGAQILGVGSEEGDLPGLNFINMEVRRFPKDQTLRVPHMGWNIVQPTNNECLFHNMPEEIRFYFLHSYYMNCHHSEDVLATATYGSVFHCAVRHHQIMGVQFHPEKSHRFGATLLKNFVEFGNVKNTSHTCFTTPE